MNRLAALATAAWLANVAQAASPQPVIRMPQPPAATAPAEQDLALPAAVDPSHPRSCLGDGTGFVRARIRGALNVDLDWKDAQLQCDGEARPDGTGLRVSFAGPGPGGRLLRLVFGVRSAREGAAGRELPTNLTVLLDGGHLYATRGDDKCTLDQLAQARLPARPGQTGSRAWRIEGRGFCVAPATALAGSGHVLLSRFDFAGRIVF